MRELVVTPRFRRAYRRFVGHDRALRDQIDEALLQMRDDVFFTSLATHKLSGELAGLWACSCGYDCRIVFTLETDTKTGRENIVLIDIGAHDDVY
jgi:mRNA-degrading endonuclease YafQ of YafQ-DinJ toxin-antitoxin module